MEVSGDKQMIFTLNRRNFKIKKVKEHFFTLYINKNLDVEKLNLFYMNFLDAIDTGHIFSQIYILNKQYKVLKDIRDNQGIIKD